MIRDLGRIEGSRAGRHAGRWVGGIGACLLLLVATPSAAVDEFAPVVTSYAQCVQEYRTRRTDYATYCRARFPLTVQEAAARSSARSAVLTSTQPATTSPAAPPPTATTPASTSVPAAPPPAYPQAPPATNSTPSRTPPRESVDITPAVNKLIEAWASRPRTPKPLPQAPRPPADPLAVIPQIQATCAAYAGNAERWRRCTTDAWNEAGLRGQPPLVLQVPPAPPPVDIAPSPAKSEPPPIRPQPRPAVIVEPTPPPQAEGPPIPSWAWLLAAICALVAAGAGGFGLSRWLSRTRSTTPDTPPAAACAPPEITLVADPGVVLLTPDGPPRAGMAVSMRFALDTDLGADTVRLDYPSLETAP